MTDQPKSARSRASPAPTTPNALELAMEAAAEGCEPSGPVRALLENQNRLIGWQIATERAAFGLKLLTAGVGIVAAVVVATVLISASQYRGLTVQPFSAPPELEARGLNGSAVATRVLDKLTALQAATVSLRAPNSYANSWGDSVEVQIPQTGVSAGELWKFLRSWLGEEVKITGEVVRVGQGLQITTRAGGQAAAPLLGQEAELEALLDRAAEAIFAETQPYRYAIYLTRSDRIDEALAALERLAAVGDHTDRKWALAAWSLQLQMLGQFEDSIAKAEAALAMDPGFGLARANLGGVLSTIGRAEEAHQQTLLAVHSIRDDRDLDPAIRDAFRFELQGNVLADRHDHLAAVEAYRRAAEGDGRSRRAAALEQAGQIAALHEYGRGRDLARQSGAADSTTGVRGFENATPLDRYEAAACLAQEDWPCVRALLTGVLGEPAATDAATVAVQHAWLTSVAPILALAHARTGDLAAAEAMMARTPTDAYFAMIARARLAALKGDVAGSERGFAQAAAAAPSLADADYYWGRARLERGDQEGAISRLAQASARAPKWADPLKAWGDALAAGGDPRGAARKYQMAAERAPRWGALHLAWGRALDAAGRRRAANARYQAAATMDLTPADRAELERRLIQARS